MTLTDQIRARLKALGLSQNALHEETGVTRAVIAKFMDGGEAHSSTLDKLFVFLGNPSIPFPAVKVRERKPGRKPKKKPGPK
jgi:predicted transcriptional regulator